MLESVTIKISKINSFPGRIRLKVENLKNKIWYASAIETALKELGSIELAEANIRTGNLLILYNRINIEEDILLEQIKSTKIFITKDFQAAKEHLEPEPYEDIFEEEKSLSRRISVLSAAAASVLLFSAAPANAAAALLLGFPGVIYITAYLSQKYTLKKAKRMDISIKNTRVIRKIQKVRSILLHPEVIIEEKNREQLNSKSYLEIENLIANDEIEDPVQPYTRKLVKNIRKIGIHDISVLSGGNKTGVLIYAVKTLGLQDKRKHCPPEMIIQKNGSVSAEWIPDNIILCSSDNKTEKTQNIDIRCYDLNKIPWLINICHRSNEFLCRSQIAAASINVFGIMLVFTGYLYLGTSLLLYLINMFGNIWYLRYKILQSNKEMHHGEQFINT